MKKKWLILIPAAFIAAVVLSVVIILSSISGNNDDGSAAGLKDKAIYYPFMVGTIDSTQVRSVKGGQPISPSKLFSGGTKRYFVYRISHYYCDSCNDFALFKIKPDQIMDALPGTECLIFADYPDGREASILIKRMEGFGATDIYIFNLDELLPMETAGMPYYFILNEDMEITDAFIASRSWNKECSNYLERLKKKYSGKL